MLIRSASVRAHDFIDLEQGEISREIFVNQEIYEQEQERIFARAWLFLGHESQIPNPGDFFVSCMGEESVILTRDERGQAHAVLNTCRHRGMKVCRYDVGNTRVFTCPYHGWSYGTDGELVGVPHYKEAYDEQLDRARWGLIEVAQLTNYKGTFWATWDEHAPSFLDYLGGMKLYLDILLDGADGSEGESELLGSVQKWNLPCNWKFPSDNIGDLYHGATTHQSVDAANIGPSGRGRRDNGRERAARINVSFPELGHAATSSLLLEDAPAPVQYANRPVVAEYFRHANEERRKGLGERARIVGGAGVVFPNTCFQPGQPRTVRIGQPRGPLLTEVWRFYLVDRAAPQEVKDVLRHYFMRYSGPGGMTEQDDMENWSEATKASRGVIARRHPYNYEMGLGMTYPDYGLDGVITGGFAEQNQRGLYQRWAQLMDGGDWDEIGPRPSGG